MIDLRANHARMRDDWVRWSLAWILGSASTFSLLLALAPSHAVYLGIAGIWLSVFPAFVLAFFVLTIRPVVAREDALFVEGEPILWRNVSTPKPALLSSACWVTVWTRAGSKDILLAAEPAKLEAIRQLRARADTFGTWPSIRVPPSTRPPSSIRGRASARERPSGTSFT